jgi:hypothetical protein
MPDVNAILIGAIRHDIVDKQARERLTYKIDKPETEGEVGQVLTKTETGIDWASVNADGSVTVNTPSDYTAFQVYPTSTEIPENDSTLGTILWDDNTLTTAVKISASQVEEFSLWITKPRSQVDIVVDWGDDTSTKVSDLLYAHTVSGIDLDNKKIYTDSAKTITADPVDGEYYCIACINASTPGIVYQFTTANGFIQDEEPENKYAIGGLDLDDMTDVVIHLSHKYIEPDQLYTVKIQGKHYCRLSHNSLRLNVNNRLLAKIFTDDLPIASHLNNFASLCYGCKRLLKVVIPSYSPLMNQITNLNACFNTCQNLNICTGWYFTQAVRNISGIFQYCLALRETDFQIGKLTYGSITTVFDGCKNLAVDILSLIGSKINIGISDAAAKSVFQNCVKLALGSHTIETDEGKVTNLITQEYYDQYKDDPEHGEGLLAAIEKAAKELEQRLWNNPTLKFSSGSNCFKGCPEIIRERVPVSWGGTMAEPIVKQAYLYFTIPTDMQLTTEDTLSLVLEFDNNDDFSTCQTLSTLSYQVFDRGKGIWQAVDITTIPVSYGGFTIRVNTPTETYNNCRYRWINGETTSNYFTINL